MISGEALGGDFGGPEQPQVDGEESPRKRSHGQSLSEISAALLEFQIETLISKTLE
jgi:hypothetical protein